MATVAVWIFWLAFACLAAHAAGGDPFDPSIISLRLLLPMLFGAILGYHLAKHDQAARRRRRR
jgi:predicted branched-subunit amino acid permease